MELQIAQRGHLLAQVLEGPHDVESIERPLEREMGVDPVEHLGQGVDDVEALAP